MSESSKASDLLWGYVAAEKRIEQAEKQILESRGTQAELLAEIKENKALVKALELTGVLCNGRMLFVRGECLEIREQPLFDFDLVALKDINDE